MKTVCYTTSRGPFEPGIEYRNPKFFTAPLGKPEAVVVEGYWPAVVAAYEAIDVAVTVKDTPGDRPTYTRDDIVDMAKADVLELLAANGVEADPKAAVTDLREQLIAAMFVDV